MNPGFINLKVLLAGMGVSPFSDIDGEESAYWLGFVLGDSSLFRETGTDRLTLAVMQSKQRQVLARRFERFLGDAAKDARSGRHKRGGPYVRVRTQDEDVIADLCEQGLDADQAKRSWPGHLGDELLAHVARGLFDANGSIGVKRSPSKSPNWQLVGQPRLVLACRAWLMDAAGVSETKPREHASGSVTVQYQGVGNLEKLWRVLYGRASTWLAYKSNVGVEEFGMPEPGWLLDAEA